MLSVRTAWVLAAVGLVAGCVGDSAEVERTIARRPLAPAAADALYLQTVLIEQSVGDPFLDTDLWQTTPSAVSGEMKALFAENGLRVCVVRGHAPERFIEMITSELTTVNPQFLTFTTRKKEVVPTNGPVAASTFQLARSLGGSRVPYSLRQVSFGWQVRPEMLDSGQVQIECVPLIQHGDRQAWLRPSGDGTQFTLHGEHPTVSFGELGFTTTLGQKDYLVIGGIADAKESLGCAAFRLDSAGQAKQRVLVIRAGKTAGDRNEANGGTLIARAVRGLGEQKE